MRHRKRGRHLGRSSSHRKAMFRNMASSLFLTEREADEFDLNPPKVPGRIVTTVAKAKEVRSLVEKCITIARKSLAYEEAAEQFETSAEPGTAAWQEWRNSDQYRQWVEARAPVVAARRRVFAMLRDKEAVRICFEVIAPRFRDRHGGYTRVLRLANPRLGDAGPQAILEFVGRNDRRRAEPTRPTFAAEPEPAPAGEDLDSPAPEAATEPTEDAAAVAVAEPPAEAEEEKNEGDES